MPIYEYVCESCGHHLEALQKMADAPLVDCPDCNQPTLKKKISAPNFRLKGKGWYETDFKDKNQRNLAGDAADKPKSDKADKKDGKDAKGKKPAADKKAD